MPQIFPIKSRRRTFFSFLSANSMRLPRGAERRNNTLIAHYRKWSAASQSLTILTGQITNYPSCILIFFWVISGKGNEMSSNVKWETVPNPKDAYLTSMWDKEKVANSSIWEARNVKCFWQFLHEKLLKLYVFCWSTNWHVVGDKLSQLALHK